MRLAGKTALITGSTSGIGRAIAEAYAAEGARVVVTGRDETRGHDVVEAIRAAGGTAEFVQGDVSMAAGARALAEQASKQFGGIDVLVNNAGFFTFGPSESVDEQDFDSIISTNLKGAFFLTAALAPSMAENGGGKVVNITTMAAHAGMPGGAVYGASKAGLSLLTKSWAAEYGPRGVNVNEISPGPVETPGALAMGEGFEQIIATVPVKRAASPDEIAAAAVYLASDDADYVHGTTLAIDGGRLAA
ncbi:MAG TPA: glucose 1-dehydrogenase [Thermoleophilaceae bacterium]|jgi:NAD(P)-dependent dehydrogenase (short-subunit alcohol dehydrogenase family)